MKQMPQVREPVTVPALGRDRMPVEPAGAIGDADLDQVSGGGGKAGGVVMRAAHRNDPCSN